MTTIQGEEIAEVYDRRNRDWTLFIEDQGQSLMVKHKELGTRPPDSEVSPAY